MRHFLLFIFIASGFTSIYGQQKESPKCYLCCSKAHEHQDPYQVSFKKELPFLITGTSMALAGFLIFENDQVTPYTPMELALLNRNDINAFDRGAAYNKSNSARQASDIVLASSLVVMPMLFLPQNHTRKDIGSLLVMTYEVLSINYGMTNIIKSAANRTRPYAYNPDYSYEERTDRESRFSFYSGHTSTTASLSFLWAQVMTDYHPDMKRGVKIGIWSFAALVPATTGYLRVKAGKHFPTDVITGYALGALTGWIIPNLHKSKGQRFSFYPTRIMGQHAIGMTIKLD